jgi:quinol monooxygenase YgiN
MDKFALWAQLEAKPGKEQEVEDFLKSAQPLALQEQGTTTWYALKISPSKYGIFDTFADETARNAHLTGHSESSLRQSQGSVRKRPRGGQTGHPRCQSAGRGNSSY